MSDTYAPPDTPLEIVHDDHEILLVDKPAGLLSVPGKGPHLADCLLARVQDVCPQALLVHRLDRDTSGLMVFALTPHAQRHLGQQFEKRRMKKTYVARVAGRLTPGRGTVDLPLIVDWPNRPRQMVDHEAGKQAVTDWRVVRATDAESRVRLSPRTGRSHQLRVHMQALGHPILGDPFYADGTALDHSRLMLHSESLQLRHPDGGRAVRFRAKCPF
ncbi:MAG: RluA family pseudouridine synthase [Salibaculum sp.]|jgi:tRNA pseudouridine32 synthase/23S rRNA pseudouridine746 synthase|uniref:RluA family pseudouridine synthase n=1 Tax=Salibaculum sp. TaxID=2855480 RepID=UPI0028702BFD|nr:RluA family pseudouridine synthase [Salibaculum sp.]MDR9427852.1 RluA family pseudouridine synthase [Salibaculum sp.]MDR9483000.1 RluA family pseudouridine synthase [Salibaculum sp.]